MMPWEAWSKFGDGWEDRRDRVYISYLYLPTLETGTQHGPGAARRQARTALLNDTSECIQ